MNPEGPGIFVACQRSALFVRVVGRGACRNSETLRRFASEKLEAGCQQVFVDLHDCDGMDSTFLGVFAGVGLRLLQTGGRLVLWNIRPESLKVITSLGLDQLASIDLRTASGLPVPEPDRGEFFVLPGSDLSGNQKRREALERAILMLECHEDLCRVADSNEDRFRDVKRFLREDIARQDSDEWAGSRPSV